ncbi:MAG: hypothetical protein EPN91_08580 [Salinibacterium sp.]|nr:MAG: hypothetical protein EPN91_08580 [Salinibacterium sp.]
MPAPRQIPWWLWAAFGGAGVLMASKERSMNAWKVVGIGAGIYSAYMVKETLSGAVRGLNGCTTCTPPNW